MTEVRKRLYTSVTRWLLRGPLLAALRRWRPIARVGGVWLVTRHADVCEVLDRDRDFGVPYGAKMQALIGPFVLGLDDETQHRRTREVLDRADNRNEPEAYREGLQRIERRAGELAEALLDDAGGAIDVVRELSDPVVHAGIADYLGVEALDARTLLRWCRAIGWDVFLNPRDDARVAREAKEAAAEMLALIEARIDERKRGLAEADAGRNEPKTLLDRLLTDRAADALDDATVRSTIAGLMVVWAVAVPRATALAVDELLRRREILDAQAAARTGVDDVWMRYFFEALRFETLAPAVARNCHGARLSGDARARVIPAEATVVAVTGSAMMDPRVVAEPKSFRGSRDPIEYGLHFGRGAHACWGEGIATAQMRAIGRALLRREGLRRSKGPAGKLIIEGAFPSQLGVAFDPAPD
ncbi:MAG: cytochrome P450 [Chloroflexi bacterium]|nr:cytochrome P450 [Chloroflexota bacterium]